MTGYNGKITVSNILTVRSLPGRYDSSRVRRLLVHPGLLLSALRMGTDGNRYTVEGLPDDAEVIDANFDDCTGNIDLRIRSATFNPVPPGSLIPITEVTITRHEPEAQLARREPEKADPTDFASMMVILRDVNEKRKTILRRLFERQGVPKDVTEAVLKEIVYDEALEEDIIRNGGTETAHSRTTAEIAGPQKCDVELEMKLAISKLFAADESIKIDLNVDADEFSEVVTSKAMEAADIEGHMLRELEQRMGEIYAADDQAEEDRILNGTGGDGPQGAIVVSGDTGERTIMVADHDGTMKPLKEVQASIIAEPSAPEAIDAAAVSKPDGKPATSIRRGECFSRGKIVKRPPSIPAITHGFVPIGQPIPPKAIVGEWMDVDSGHKLAAVAVDHDGNTNPINNIIADRSTGSLMLYPEKVVIKPDMTPIEIEQARQQVREIFAVFGTVKIMVRGHDRAYEAFNDVIGQTQAFRAKLNYVADGVEVDLVFEGGVPIPEEPAIDEPIIR